MAGRPGEVKLSHVQTYDVTLQEGTPYRQLVQKEDSALSPSGQRVIPQRRESGARAPREEYRRAPTRDRREAELTGIYWTDFVVVAFVLLIHKPLEAGCHIVWEVVQKRPRLLWRKT
jgi:hypothetical protein